MDNPFPNSKLFVTPASIEELTDIADNMSKPAEAWRMMVLVLNYAHAEWEREVKGREDLKARLQASIKAKIGDPQRI